MTEEIKAIDKDRPICFVVMPISDVDGYDTGHFGRVYDHLLKPAIVDAGFRPVRSDDTAKTDYIVVGVVQRVVNSEMVLCDYSARNPNVMYELGIRHAFNRPVALIRDTRTDKVFDIQGLRYTEYDSSLRIDTVQKDTARISAAIRETANAQTDGFNSVVQLAGLKTAKVPAEQEVSPDTQLVLAAIASLERRVQSSEERSASKERFFRITGSGVQLSDNDHVSVGEQIYDGPGNLIGTLVETHPFDEEILVKRQNGAIIALSAFSVRSKNLTTLPF